MLKKFSAIFLVLLFLPLSAFATDTAITRRDGFLLLWNAIHRPAETSKKAVFADVPVGDPGFTEITYAEKRGLIDEAEAFHPDQSLNVETALLWLMRTRNVDDIDQLTVDNLPVLLDRYPLGDFVLTDGDGKKTIVDKSLTTDELTTLMMKFDELLLNEQHEVSLYSEKFQGAGTAFGEKFDMNTLTAAHRTFPYNTLVKVTNVDNGKSVTVRINDRGPFVPGRDMDLSLAAFTSIADRSKGKIMATFQRLGDVNLVNGCGQQVQYHQVIRRGVILTPGVPNVLRLGSTLTLQASDSFVVRSVQYPDGMRSSVENWIVKGEEYSFTPSTEGDYTFIFSAKTGGRREMKMHVAQCQ